MGASGKEQQESLPAEPSRRVWDIFDQASDLKPAEQQALLKAACAGDPELRSEVERLLANDARLAATEGGRFLKSPVHRAPPEASGGEASPHPPLFSDPALPRQLGKYRLVRLLGEGGMGAVYEAEQDSPGRTVAVKVVRPGLAVPALLERFRHESQILSRLHHAGIAQVYEAGLADNGQPFFAMEFIRGLPLNEYARARSLTLPARLELLARVCDAVQHAHERGVIHRDLKPANILVEEPGHPKVLDFGVARATDLFSGAGLTRTGQLLGTPNYMSPEQVSGKPTAIDHRADVYALGVILFELATHRLPFQLENRPLAEAARLILEEDAPRLGSLNPELRGDLETIAAKALAKDAARRYASAADLAADLRRFVAHEAILARPPSALYHLRQFSRRHKGLVGGVAATGAALVLGLAGTILFAVAEARQRGQAEQSALEANNEKQAAFYQTYRACLAAASAALQNHDVGDAARQLEAAPKALRGWEWQHLHTRLDDSSSVVSLPADGGVLIAAPDRLRFGVWTGAGLRLSDLDGGDHGTVPLGPQYKRHGGVAQTRRGLRVAAWVGNSAFDLLDEAGQVLCRVALPKNEVPHTVVMSPDGARMACWTDRNQSGVAILDATTGKQIATCNGHSEAIWAFTFSPDGSTLATGSEDQTARLWNAANGAPLATCSGHTSKVVSTAFSPDGSRLVTASTDGTVRQWDARTGKEVEPAYDRHSSDVFSAVYSPDGQWIASAGDDRTIRVWRARGREDVALLHGHSGRITDLAFAPDGRRLASLSSRSALFSAGDDTVRGWDVDPEATLPVLRGHARAIYPVAYSPDGRWLASGSWDRTVQLWDAATGEPCATMLHKSIVGGVAFGPDGTWLVTSCLGKDRLWIWDVATASVRKEFRVPDRGMISLTVSPDGTRVATTGGDTKTQRNYLTVCDLKSGESIFSTEGSSLAYSPDGHWLAALAADGKTIQLRDARTHAIAAQLSGHEMHVTWATFSSDSRFLASCSLDRTVRVWEVAGGEWRVASKEETAGKEKVPENSREVHSPLATHQSPPSMVLHGHTDEVYAVAFHPDGTRLASAGRDGTVWLWDLARGEEVVRLPGHRSLVWSLAFSPDGATLASGSGDFTVRLWDTAPLKTRYQARREAAALRPEADRLVKRLWPEKKDPADVVQALRTDRDLSDEQRHAAIRAVLRHVRPPASSPHPGNVWFQGSAGNAASGPGKVLSFPKIGVLF